jgi:hypothetical protein
LKEKRETVKPMKKENYYKKTGKFHSRTSKYKIGKCKA